METKDTKGNPEPKVISVEEHFSTIEHLDRMREIVEKIYHDREVIDREKYIENDAPFLTLIKGPATEAMLSRLLDTGNGRVQIMDESNIQMQVLSFVSPGVQVFDNPTAIRMSKDVNDLLSKIVKENPTRFAGLASLPMQDPDEAAAELERSIKDLDLKGACIFTHTRGEYPDDKKYWVVFQKASELNAPIYLHPRAPSPHLIKAFAGYPTLDTAMWGFSVETGTCAMRLMCSGIFDEYPDLKIILGHLGEGIPFWLWRIDNWWKRTPLSKNRGKTPSQYFKNNFLVTTSGMFHELALAFTMSIIGAENIMFSVDYPMESPLEAVEFMNRANMSQEDKEKIFHLNAERIFSL